MPLNQKINNFIDISMSFKSNPLTKDLISIKNETSIARSIKNIILTNTGERFFNPYLGSDVNKLIFDTIDPSTANIISQKITNSINNFEPRVRLIEVIATPNYDENVFDVYINYTIVGIDASPQQLTIALEPTR